ncbi:hypothetical protein [Bythopirellula goksoeyrii]|nr:hypothetical protein [Bythopirellula goksoeyrii]
MANINHTEATAPPFSPGWDLGTTAEVVPGQRFYLVFLLCLALTSIPVKNLAYIVPPVFLFLELIVGEKSAWRTLLLMALFATLSGVSMMYDGFRGQAINVPGLLFALLTYLPMFLFLASRPDREIDSSLFTKFINLTAWFVIVQSLVGVIQFVISRNGDAVTGTFGLLDFHLNTISITQVYFTFTLFGMILFLMLDARRLLPQVAIVAGLLTCAIAQSGHQTVFFAASLALCCTIQFRRFGTALGGIALVGCLTFIVVQLYPDTIMHTQEWYRKVVQDPRSAKRMVLTDSAEYLSDPKNALLGVGLGQYTSRAALISSNTYLNRELPGPLSGRSDYFVDSMLPAMHRFDEVGEGSAISKPYFSALSAAMELGPPLTFVCLGVLGVHLLRNLHWMLSSNPKLARAGLVSCIGLLFFLLCCVIENYLEFPQAIFLPFLLYLVVQARATQLSTRSPA